MACVTCLSEQLHDVAACSQRDHGGAAEEVVRYRAVVRVRPKGVHGAGAGEASGSLVAPAVFKTDVAEHLGQAGSIPVRLRHPRRRHEPATADLATQGARS